MYGFRMLALAASAVGGDMRKGVVAFLIVVAALVVAANYSVYSATYECSGVMTKTPITLSIKITQARWWVFWESFDGVLSLELPSTTVPIRHDFAIKRKFRDYLFLYRWPDSGGIDLTKPAQGDFSTISNFLRLPISDQEFRGTCTPRNN